jgi:hypothetical protein
VRDRSQIGCDARGWARGVRLMGVAALALLATFACAACSTAGGAVSEQAGEADPTTAPEAHDEAHAEPAPPPGPPKRIFTKRFVVNVRTGPSPQASRVGYLRAGSVLQATSAEPVGHEECRGGWFELTTGGFVCNGRDVIAFHGERLPEVRSAQPDRQAKLPYEYGLIRRDRTPMYRRLPNDAQAAHFEPQPEPPKPRPVASGEGRDGGASGAAEGVASPVATKVEEPSEPPPPPTLDGLLASRDEKDILMRWLMRGFYVSLDRTFDVGRRRYWRTQQNGFVPVPAIMPVSGSDFQGVELDGESWALPVAFVISGKTGRFVERDGGRLVRDRQDPGYHHVFRVVGEREHRGRAYLQGADGFFYRADEVVRVDARERPAALTDAKWLDVNLGRQTLVAYDGERPVYVTLISSGRVRREDVPEMNHATPAGTYRFSSKHLTGTMDGDSAIDGPYSIDDVPYVMYFHLAYATHSAFWHNRFGRPKSHGCVNMAPVDARWVFEWADPPLPEGWHGVYPTEDGPATSIVIEGETPRG